MYSQTTGCAIYPRPTTTSGAASACVTGRFELRRSDRAASHPEPAPHAGARDRVITFQPEVLAPRERDLTWLPEADQFLVKKVLLEPLVYIHHPIFEDPTAETVLFGGAAVLEPRATYFAESDLSLLTHSGGAVLDRETECLLFQRFNYSRMRVADLLQSNQGRRMGRADLQYLLGWLHRALMIRGMLAQANIRLVLTMAKRPQFSSLDSSDVISAGNFALLRSIDRFDCSRGFKFSTYACQGILQRILHVVDSTRRYRSRFISDFDETLDRDDSAARRHEAQEQEWLDELRAILADNRARLTPLEVTVIQHRFGLQVGTQECKVMTLKEIGELMGVTKERIRQVQKRALEKLRAVMSHECLAA